VQVVATKEEVQEGLKRDSPPSLLIVGQLLKCDEVLIAALGQGPIRSLWRPSHCYEMFDCCVLYLNFCYPNTCSNTYIFIQKHVLQILDSNHTPVKVTVFANELSK